MFVLVTGGSGSGKSEFAEETAMSMGGKRVYIAAMKPADGESMRRIERHQKMRAGKDFVTVERYVDVKNLDVGGTALLECMSNLLANEVYSKDGAGDDAESEIMTGVEHLLEKCDNLVIVTNEIFSDGIDYDDETKRYMKTLGSINRRLAKKADAVYEVVCGVSIRIK